MGLKRAYAVLLFDMLFIHRLRLKRCYVLLKVVVSALLAIRQRALLSDADIDLVFTLRRLKLCGKEVALVPRALRALFLHIWCQLLRLIQRVIPHLLL